MHPTLSAPVVHLFQQSVTDGRSSLLLSTVQTRSFFLPYGLSTHSCSRRTSSSFCAYSAAVRALSKRAGCCGLDAYGEACLCDGQLLELVELWHARLARLGASFARSCSGLGCHGSTFPVEEARTFRGLKSAKERVGLLRTKVETRFPTCFPCTREGFGLLQGPSEPPHKSPRPVFRVRRPALEAERAASAKSESNTRRRTPVAIERKFEVRENGQEVRGGARGARNLEDSVVGERTSDRHKRRAHTRRAGR